MNLDWRIRVWAEMIHERRRGDKLPELGYWTQAAMDVIESEWQKAIEKAAEGSQ